MGKLVKQPHGGAVMQAQPGESGNPKGRPPKILSTMIKELKAAGYERVSASSIFDAYEFLMGLDEGKLKKAVNDKDAPMVLRIVGKAMMGKNGHEIIEKMIDRAHGKSVQRNDLTTGGEKINVISADYASFKQDSDSA